MEFKDQLKKEFIPAIEEMLEKESAHLVYMMDVRDRILAGKGLKLFSVLHSNYEMDNMIARSKLSVVHLRKRLLEYTEYANKP